MPVALSEWLELIDGEYLRDFIVPGGAAIKFVVTDDDTSAKLNENFAEQAVRHGLVFAEASSADARLHMMQDIFFAVSRQINWSIDAQRFVETLFQGKGYQWPKPNQPMDLREVAEANQVDATILRREFNQWLSSALMKDANMAQDFRIAMTQLCLNCLVSADNEEEPAAPISEWLRGELRLIGSLKSAHIYSKITRHNARAMFRSLCRWLRLTGHQGLFLTIDIRQVTRTAAMAADGVRYTSSAVMDAYEVLRQLLDDADLYEGLFVVIMADHAFTGGDPKRSVDAYVALKMRIWDDVRARARDNPLAPMVVIDAIG